MGIFNKKKTRKAAVNYVVLLQAINPQLMGKTFGELLSKGVSINLFPLKDKSALGISLYKDGDTEKEYVSSKDSLEQTLYAYLDAMGVEATLAEMASSDLFDDDNYDDITF